MRKRLTLSEDDMRVILLFCEVNEENARNEGLPLDTVGGQGLRVLGKIRRSLKMPYPKLPPTRPVRDD